VPGFTKDSFYVVQVCIPCLIKFLLCSAYNIGVCFWISADSERFCQIKCFWSAC